MLPISKFRIKPGGEVLTKTDFEDVPAWSEHYDYEDIDLIASWGIDRNWVAQQFKEMDTGGAHPHFTILDLDRLPHDNMRIFLKAEFSHRSGRKIAGFIMNADAFCIRIFLREGDFTFSRHPLLRKDAAPAKRAVEAELGVSELFPLTYRTNFSDADGRPIEGEFSLGE